MNIRIGWLTFVRVGQLVRDHVCIAHWTRLLEGFEARTGAGPHWRLHYSLLSGLHYILSTITRTVWVQHHHKQYRVQPFRFVSSGCITHVSLLLSISHAFSLGTNNLFVSSSVCYMTIHNSFDSECIVHTYFLVCCLESSDPKVLSFLFYFIIFL